MKTKVLTLLLLFSITSDHIFSQEVKRTGFQYASFRDSIFREEHKSPYDSTNFFDDGDFNPANSSFDSFLVRMEESLKQQLAEKRHQPDLEYNKAALESFRAGRNKMIDGTCRGNECDLYVEVVKSEQKMYLYLYGSLLDTFAVSTGVGEYETPNLDLRPSGPVFIRYSSKKFPGGNYMGLGNMPYAVFLKGGYAIHGTTTGNIKKLGTPASHGCIRLHPDNARVFNELVRQVGLEYTWVRVVD